MLVIEPTFSDPQVSCVVMTETYKNGGVIEYAPFAKALHFHASKVHGEAHRRGASKAESAAMKQLQVAVAKRRSLFGNSVSDGRSLFAAVDADGSGEISRAEFSEALLRLGISDAHLDEIVHRMDTNDNGKIELEEFIAASGLDDAPGGVSAAETAVRASQERKRQQRESVGSLESVKLTSQEREERATGAARSTLVKQLRSVIAHKRTLYGHTIADVPSLFAAIDSDGSGAISQAEFRDGLQRLSLGISGEILDRIAASVDEDDVRTQAICRCL